MMFGHVWRFPDIPGRFGMFPDDSGAFQIVSGAFRSGESPEKSDLFKKVRRPKLFVGRKRICWESSEMDLDEVSAGLDLILGGKRSFEVWGTAVFERSESREASRAKRVERSEASRAKRIVCDVR